MSSFGARTSDSMLGPLTWKASAIRCLSVQLATRPNLSVEDKTGAYSLTTASGEEHQFAGIVDVAKWATATAFE
jgi:hypothetical protein